jgi:hypothetical protein
MMPIGPAGQSILMYFAKGFLMIPFSVIKPLMYRDWVTSNPK